MTDETKDQDGMTIQDDLKRLRREIDDCKRECNALKSRISIGNTVAAALVGVVLLVGLVLLLHVQSEQLIFASVFALLAVVLLLMWLWIPADDRVDLEVIQIQRIKASVGVLTLATLLGIATLVTLRFAPCGGNGCASQATVPQITDVSSTAVSNSSQPGSPQGKPGGP